MCPLGSKRIELVIDDCPACRTIKSLAIFNICELIGGSGRWKGMGDDSWAASWLNRRLILKTGLGECNAFRHRNCHMLLLTE